jgi:plasmid segregation protein ParM
MAEHIVRALDIGHGFNKYSTSSLAVRGSIGTSSFPALTHVTNGDQAFTGGGIVLQDVWQVPIGNLTYVAGKDIQKAVDSRASRNLEPQYSTTDAYLALARAAMCEMKAPRINTLVVGLPNTTMSKYKDMVIKRFTGEHTAVRPGSGSLESRTMHVVVDSVVCIPQAVGGYLDYAGENAHQTQFNHRLVLLIDPGFFTLDWVVAKGMSLIEPRCGAEEGGMSYCIEGMKEAAESILKRKIGYAHLIDDALRHGYDPEIYGKTFNMESVIPTGKARAEALMRKLAAKVGDSADIGKIVLVGGGAHFFLDVVRAKYPDQSVVVATNSEFANVRGFQLYGERIAARMGKRK